MAIRAPNLFGNIDWSGYHRANEYTVEAGRAKGEAAANIGKSLSFGLQLVGQRREKAKDQARASAEKADDRAYAEQQREAEYGRRLQFEKDLTTFQVGQQLQQEMEATKQAIAMLPPDAPQPDEQQAQNIQAALRLGERIGPAVDVVSSRVERNADAGGLEQSDLANSLREAMARHGQYSTAKQVAAKKGVAPAVLYRLAGEEAKAAADVEILKGSLQRKEGEAKTALQAQHDAKRFEFAAQNPEVQDLVSRDLIEQLRHSVGAGEVDGTDALRILAGHAESGHKKKVAERNEYLAARRASEQGEKDYQDSLEPDDADKIIERNRKLREAGEPVPGEREAKPEDAGLDPDIVSQGDAIIQSILSEHAGKAAPDRALMADTPPDALVYAFLKAPAKVGAEIRTVLNTLYPTPGAATQAINEMRKKMSKPAGGGVSAPAPAGDPYEALAEWLRTNPGATPEQKKAKARELKGIR